VAAGLATITIGIDPMIRIGPVTIAWHGLTIAIGIVVGGIAAAREARARGLPTAPLQTVGLILVVAALVGSRVYYLAEHGDLLNPAEWFGTRGYTFYGGLIAAALGIGAYLRWRRLSVEYLDTVAFGLPLGIAIGRVGDIINGEHYGPPTDFFLGVRNSHPDADVPSHEVAYHSGGLYEVLIGALTFVVLLALRGRLRRPTAMTWLVVALLSVGRFAEFFARSDSETVALGLEAAQWTSLLLLVAAGVGAWMTLRRQGGARAGRAPDVVGGRRA
jgi:phosphatidylglycerol---prolipoprotein diacylglyceryl transferase